MKFGQYIPRDIYRTPEGIQLSAQKLKQDKLELQSKQLVNVSFKRYKIEWKLKQRNCRLNDLSSFYPNNDIFVFFFPFQLSCFNFYSGDWKENMTLREQNAHNNK